MLRDHSDGVADCFASDDIDAAQDMNAAVAAEVAPPAIRDNPDVAIAATAGSPVLIDSAGGDSASMSLPGAGIGADVGTTTVFDGAAPDTQVGVQPTQDGFRALVRIDSQDAPERYDYVVGGDAASLRLEEDGSVTVLNADGGTIAYVESPWARDANGVDIPTRYDVSGLTLTQVVQHRGAGYAYPIVADPFWSDAWKVVKCTAAVGAFIAGNLLLATKVRKSAAIAGINAVVKECG